MPSTLRRLHHRVRRELGRPQSRAGIGREERIAGAAGEHDDPAFGKMVQAPPGANRAGRAPASRWRRVRAAGDFASSSAPSIASAFMTVASMPIESARARSMPVSAPGDREKNFRPQRQHQLQCRATAALAMSLAMRATVGACRPNPPSPPVSASPDSLMMTRFPIRLSPGNAHRRLPSRNFGLF